MSGGTATPSRRARWAAVALAGALTASGVGFAAGAAAATNRIDLRVLVVDDGSAWVTAIANQFTLEGVPFTDVSLSDPGRPTIDAAFLADGSEAKFQAVVVPDSPMTGVPAAEAAALTAYEAQFGVRQVDGFDWANPTVGLNYAASPNGFLGDLTGITASVSDEGQAAGFGYLNGPVPFGVGTYGYIATPLSPQPAGSSFTTLLSMPVTGSTVPGSVIGVYTSGGVEKLVITGAFSATLSHYRLLAHGIVSWATHGVHFGYNRNYLTFHFDDAFSYDSRWDMVNHCTPGEDCPAGEGNTTDIRMQAADVDHVAAWEQANGYTLTLPFNGYYSVNDNDGNPWNGTDALTNELVAKKDSFRWLNHGYEHIFQGCQQDFTVIPWVCKTTDGQPVAADGSNILWVATSDINNEITNNIARGQALGLPFDASEYLSGEHSGLFHTPQQPVDNPNFGAALTQQSITSIGADASREPAQRQVGNALTVPRHPVAVYYNVSTTAEEVSEYNWFYNTRANGGSGYCEDNQGTATCLTAPLGADGFTSYIVPSDSDFDLHFVLSNDPRPFYAHVSNLTGPDYLGLTLLDAILGKYRAAFAGNAPPVNLTLNQSADALARQQAWSTAGMGANPTATGYVQDGKVTITNTGTTAAPVTVPEGTLVNGAPFGDSYGGERSGWVAGNAILTVPGPTFTSATAATFTVGTPGSFTVTTTGAAAPAITVAGSLPAGVTLADNGNGTATLAGTPAAGGAAVYPLTFSATAGLGVGTQAFTLTVNDVPPAPTIGTAAPGDASATVNWTAPADNGSPITGYTVRVYDGVTNTVLTTSTADAGATHLNVTGLTNGASYSFDVAASNAVGAGPASARSNPVTPSGLPAAPVIGTATAGDSQATVNWTPPADGGSPIASYTVRQYDGTSNSVLATYTVVAPASSLPVTSLTNGASYSFDVAATNQSGTGPASARSNAVTPAGLTAGPTIGTATPGNASATVTWTPPSANGSPISGYAVRVYAGTTDTVLSTVSAGPTVTTLTITGLTNGSTYSFDVAAVTSVGVGVASARSNAVTPRTVPGAPTIGTATRANASAIVTWTPPTSDGGAAITGYTVTVYAGGGSAVVKTVAAAAGTTSLTVTGLTNGSRYSFAVAALNVAGAGPQSVRSNTVTPAPVPDAPTIGPATAGNRSAVVTWTPPANTGGSAITGYRIRVFVGTGTTVLRTLNVGVGTSATVTNLTNATAYTFTVAALNATGVGPFSAPSAPVTPMTVPSAPSIGTASSGAAGGATTAIALWSPPSNTGGSAITGYVVIAQRIVGGNVVSQTLSAVQPATASSLEMTLPAGNYRFRVQALNAAGTGNQSARSNQVTAR